MNSDHAEFTVRTSLWRCGQVCIAVCVCSKSWFCPAAIFHVRASVFSGTPAVKSYRNQCSRTRIYRISADCDIYPIYTSEILFCTVRTENFIRYIQLSDITESDTFEFYCILNRCIQQNSNTRAVRRNETEVFWPFDTSYVRY